MNYIEQVANMLGVKLYEEFTIKPTGRGEACGYKTNEDTVYRFDTELVHKGYNDGYSEWYGGHEKELNYLILGLYKIVCNKDNLVDKVISSLDKLKVEYPEQEITVETINGTVSFKIGDALIYESMYNSIVIDAE